MNGLRSALQTIFPADAFLSGTSLNESGRKFSISAKPDDDVVGFRPEAVKEWPEDQRRCDAVFLCQSAGEVPFRVVLVELKGGDVRHALTQLEQTHDFLCRKSGRLSPHSKNGKRGFQPAGLRHHPTIWGWIVARRGISLKQRERKALLGKGLHVRIQTGKAVQMTAAELTRRTQ
jgi:hypothetical protein